MLILLKHKVGSTGKSEREDAPDVCVLSGKFTRKPPVEPPPEPEKKHPPIHPPARDPQPEPIKDPPVPPHPGKDPDDEPTPIGDPPDKSDHPIRMEHTPAVYGWETPVILNGSEMGEVKSQEVAEGHSSRLLKNSKMLERQALMHQSVRSQQRRQDVQKGPSSPALRHVEGKAGGALAGGAYEGVREHDKGPRTPLANFFNILLELGFCIILFTPHSDFSHG